MRRVVRVLYRAAAYCCRHYLRQIGMTGRTRGETKKRGKSGECVEASE